MAATAEHKFETVRAEYHDFFRPAVKITADGNDLAEDLQCRIHSVSVNLSLGLPSEAQFELLDCYDREGHRTRNGLLSKLLPGTKVEVSLGYGSSLTSVFGGYIDCTEIEFSEDDAQILRVRACDVCRLMQAGGGRRRIIHAGKHSEAFLEVMKGYSGFCSASAEDTDIELTQGMFQEESDYDFVSGRLVEEMGYGFEFLVEKGKASFRKCDPDRKPLIELSPEQGIRNMKLGLLYVNRDIEVLGYSPEQGGLLAKGSAVSSHTDSRAAKGTEVFRAPWAASQEGAEGLAASYTAYLKENAGLGTVTTAGLPLLLPGNYIAVKNVDPEVDGKHYIIRAEHVLGEDGYETRVTVL